MVIYSEFSHETWWIFPVRYVNVYQAGYVYFFMTSLRDVTGIFHMCHDEHWGSKLTILRMVIGY